MKIQKIINHIVRTKYHGGNIVGKPKAPLFYSRDIRYAQQYPGKLYHITNKEAFVKGDTKRNWLLKKYITEQGINKIDVKELTPEEIHQHTMKCQAEFGIMTSIFEIKDPDCQEFKLKLCLALILLMIGFLMGEKTGKQKMKGKK